MNALAITTNPKSIPAMIAAASLASMLTGGHFSICKIKDAAKVAGVKLSAETLAQCTALHCVDWTLMPEALRLHVLALCESIVAAANSL